MIVPLILQAVDQLIKLLELYHLYEYLRPKLPKPRKDLWRYIRSGIVGSLLMCAFMGGIEKGEKHPPQSPPYIDLLNA